MPPTGLPACLFVFYGSSLKAGGMLSNFLFFPQQLPGDGVPTSQLVELIINRSQKKGERKGEKERESRRENKGEED